MQSVYLPLPNLLKPYGKLIVFIIGQVLAALAYYYLDSGTALLVIQALTGAGVYQQPNIKNVSNALTSESGGRHRASD